MKFGAAGFLTKRAPAKEFIAAVRKIISGINISNEPDPKIFL